MKKIILIIYFASISLLSFSQLTLNIDSCRKRALIYSEEIKIAASQQNQAEFTQKIQRANYFPKVSMSGNYLYQHDKINYQTEDGYLPTFSPDLTTGEMIPNLMINPATGQPIIGTDGNPVFNQYAYLPSSEFEFGLRNVYTAALNVEQAIYTGGKIQTANKLAEIGTKMSDLNLQNKQSAIILSADKAYWTYISVKEKVKVVLKYVDLLKSLSKTLENNYNSGMLTRNELLKAKVKLNNAKLTLQKAQNGLELSRMNLCMITGLDFQTQITTQDSIIIIDNNFDNEDLADPTKRPDYKLLEQKTLLDKNNIDLVKADFLPQMGVKASYSFIGGIEFNNSTINNNGFSVMASINIPLWNWSKGKNKISSAKIEHEISQLQLEKYSELMTLEIYQAKFNLQDSYKRVETTKTALEQADENMLVSKNSYETGMEILTNYLDAQAQWQEIYSEYIDAKTDCKIKKTEYLKASGSLQNSIIK